MRHDRHSYAEPDLVRTIHLDLALHLDFDERVLSGTATHRLDWSGGDRLVLDTRELAVTDVHGQTGDTWEPLSFEVGEHDDELGAPLTIAAPDHPERIRVSYATTPGASGLQWLEPEMTAGGAQPFMFSQSQAIHARSWVPVQDTPRVRISYAAHVTAPDDVMVLMSADNGDAPRRTGIYDVRMPEPIPSYLLAIAAGDLVFERIDDRCGVWAEPEMAKRAAAEFSDLPQMMTVTESLFGPYRWGRYDVLVLPPSFPYGGMENPRMTFATPTVVTGDKSLVSVIAHELAHSWSGNLVTQDGWDDIWLNEGFTAYVENRIVEAVYGAEQAAMETAIKQHAVEHTLAPMTPEQVRVELPGLDHGGEFHGETQLGHLKGTWFLTWLEQRYGREVFDPFLRGYFDTFAFRSIGTPDFVAHLRANLLDGAVTDEELAAWLHEPGIPAFAERAESPRFEAVDAVREEWLAGGPLPDPSSWTTHEWLRFLERLPDRLETGRLVELDRAFLLTGTANGEIARRWYALCGYGRHEAAYDELAAFLARVGRMKLVLPVYRALSASDQEELAREVFDRARPGYHPITTAAVTKIL
jgi:leukotriene-A4 hydrolase